MTTDPANTRSSGGEPEAGAPAAPPPAAPGPPDPRPARGDRWAHRRGEPRLFVFLWTMYLFCATVLTLAAVSAAGYLTVDRYRPAGTLLLATVVAGIVLLWPLVRLSQTMPGTRAGAFAGAVQDYFVVMLPAQAVIWPQWSLAGLPGGVVAALSVNVAAWGLVVGALLAHATIPRVRGSRDPTGMSTPGRTAWMLVFVGVAAAGAGPLLAWVGDPSGVLPEARRTWLLSPVTSVFEHLADRSWTGRPAAVTWAHWRASGVVALGAMALWVAAWVRVRGAAGRVGGRAAASLH